MLWKVASWGGDMLDRGVLTVSLAPRDNHEAQVQFALERGIPAILGVLSTQRLPFPSNSFDMAHCSRCLIPWTEFGNSSSNYIESIIFIYMSLFWETELILEAFELAYFKSDFALHKLNMLFELCLLNVKVVLTFKCVPKQQTSTWLVNCLCRMSPWLMRFSG